MAQAFNEVLGRVCATVLADRLQDWQEHVETDPFIRSELVAAFLHVSLSGILAKGAKNIAELGDVDLAIPSVVKQGEGLLVVFMRQRKKEATKKCSNRATAAASQPGLRAAYNSETKVPALTCIKRCFTEETAQNKDPETLFIESCASIRSSTSALPATAAERRYKYLKFINEEVQVPRDVSKIRAHLTL